MIKRTKILKTRYKYKGLCNQSKEIIFFFVPVQDTLPSRTSPAPSSLQLPKTLRDKRTCLKLHIKHVKY